MMQLEVGGRRYGVTSGETVVGSDPASGIVLEGEGIESRHLLLTGLADGSVAVRAAGPGAEAMLNGVALGTDPTPVLHGDKLRVGGHELLVIDSAQAGATRLAPAVKIVDADALPPVSRPVGLGPGRLVSLTDGREYQVDDEPLILGRDAAAHVVVGSDDASRRHAEVRPTAGGYVLVDHSSNGTRVNGQPVAGSRVLARGDVIAIGTDEFRFTADPVRALPDVPQLNDTLFGVPAFTPPSGTSRPAAPIAALLVRSGGLKGQRLLVRTPVANLGRAEYNDVVVDDASVSASHAKLQYRDGVWVLTDLGSTNGTFVDGEPAIGDMPLGPGATIKIGAVRLMFEPYDQPVEPAPARAGTRQMEAPASDVAAAPAPAGPPDRPQPARPVRPPRVSVGEAREERSSFGIALLLAVVAAAAVVVYLLLS